MWRWHLGSGRCVSQTLDLLYIGFLGSLFGLILYLYIDLLSEFDYRPISSVSV